MREVEALMREGFGVEDIALKLGVDLKLVRRHVKRLRARGEITTIYRAWSQDRARLEMKRSEGGVAAAPRT